MLKFIFSLLMVSLMASGCSTALKDLRDGQNYKTVRIGNQVWMAKNLNYNGGEGCHCYETDDHNCKKYGMLYTWEAAQKACPEGWHLPTEAEWKELASNFGGVYTGDAYVALTARDSVGFAAYLGGYLNDNGEFKNIEKFGNYWSSSEYDPEQAWGFIFYGAYRRFVESYSKKVSGLSCRCIQNDVVIKKSKHPEVIPGRF